MKTFATKFPLLALALVLSSLVAGCDDDDDKAPGPFSYRSDGPEKYARVDRMGQPATGTALLSRVPGTAPANQGGNQRDAFNRGNPDTDAANFATPMLASLRRIHVQLEEQLRSFGLDTCSTGTGSATNIDACTAQAAPVILPDVVTIAVGAGTSASTDGWPNGRGFDDPVVDRLLAAALLDLANPAQNINTLAGLPLNPPGNDGNAGDSSPTSFPYLRPMHVGPGL